MNPFTLQLDEVRSPTEALIQGRPTMLFGTNNYLGLNFDPTCRAAAAEALAKEGTGTTASRVASGSYSGHIDLEREIAAFFDRDCVQHRLPGQSGRHLRAGGAGRRDPNRPRLPCQHL
ncbi:MAG: aminotransferase class I/II-fold pyridoxal phosphate-dependent enzyme [Alphaproteobacteria bacterium]